MPKIDRDGVSIFYEVHGNGPALILTHGGRIHANRYAEEWRKDDPDEAIAAAGLVQIVAHKKGELERAADIVGITNLITLDLDDAMAVVREDVVESRARRTRVCSPAS